MSAFNCPCCFVKLSTLNFTFLIKLHFLKSPDFLKLFAFYMWGKCIFYLISLNLRDLGEWNTHICPSIFIRLIENALMMTGVQWGHLLEYLLEYQGKELPLALWMKPCMKPLHQDDHVKFHTTMEKLLS